MPLSSSSVDRRIPEALSMSETDYGDAGWVPVSRLREALGTGARLA
jgi:hypothetical protein